MQTRNDIEQVELVRFLKNEIRTAQWITIHEIRSSDLTYLNTSTLLIPFDKADEAINRSNQNFFYDEYRPGLITYYPRQESIYFRHGNDDGFEPLCYQRKDKDGNKFIEISEEFRHFYDLVEDNGNLTYSYHDDDGEVVTVIRRLGDTIQVHARHIREFLGVKKMKMLLHTYSEVFSEHKPGDFGLGTYSDTFEIRGCTVTSAIIEDESDYYNYIIRTRSEVRGKILIEPLPDDQIYWQGFSKKHREYTAFIIGLDDNMLPLEFTSNPDMLANFFGANQAAPNYLTPVFFRGCERFCVNANKPHRAIE